MTDDTRRAVGQVGDTTTVPRLVDPGEGGWAPEPKVSQAELLLYGDAAGAIRLLGQAAAAAQDAYSLICKHAQPIVDAPDEVVDKDVQGRHQALIGASWELCEKAVKIYRDVALMAGSMTSASRRL